MPNKLLYAQSGGVTAVINATAAAAIETARAAGVALYAARNGILGLLHEELIDTGRESRAAIATLAHTPGGAFGSCRYRLPPLAENPAEHERLIAVLRAHEIGCVLYNGGNDSADTALRLARSSRRFGYPLQVIGVPKTVDNDLAVTDSCPGFGSVAKYVALATLESGYDVEAMRETSTRVFILEVMGRNAGWIAAAAGLAARRPEEPPHLILFPEVAFQPAEFLARVQDAVARFGYCSVVTAEGLRDASGTLLSAAGGRDAFGHQQLGGVAPRLAALVGARLGHKCHWALPDYLQRSARHLASQVDLEHARAVGQAAVEYALAGRSGVMPVIRRLSDTPYRWSVEAAPLARIANREKKLPRRFIRSDGYGISAQGRRYLEPLIRGEAMPPWGKDGLPRYSRLRNVPVARRLPEYAR